MAAMNTLDRTGTHLRAACLRSAVGRAVTTEPRGGVWFIASALVVTVMQKAGVRRWGRWPGLLLDIDICTTGLIGFPVPAVRAVRSASAKVHARALACCAAGGSPGSGLTQGYRQPG